MKNILILTHTDLDGFFSGAICYEAAQKLLFRGEDKEITVKEWTYNYNLPSVDAIKKKYDAVIVADLMPDVNFMLALYDENNPDYLTWFDHHVAPDEALEKAGGDKIKGLRTKEKKAGCMMAWKYYHPHEEPNFVLEMVSDYDAWNRDGVGESVWENEVMPIFTYLDVHIKDWKDAILEMERCDNMMRDHTILMYKKSILSEGKIIRNAKKSRFSRERSDGFEMLLHCIVCEGNESTPQEMITEDYTPPYRNYRAFVVNTQTRGSELFEDLYKSGLPGTDYDVFIVFNTTGKKWKYSMYTFKDDIACNTLMPVGIGPDGKGFLRFRGHKGAAGSVSDELMLFDKTMENTEEI